MNGRALTFNMYVEDINSEKVVGAQLCLLSSNGTYINAVPQQNGTYELSVPDERPGTLLVAHKNYAAFFIDDWTPQEQTLHLKSEEAVGSVIIFSTGYIDGLIGRLNPIKDSLSRLYIYGDNISFDDIDTQPYYFEQGIPFTAEDSMRNRFELVVLRNMGRTFLIQYRLLPTLTA